MASNPPPGYELADRIALTTSAQVRAISDPLRTTILGLLHEREATVSELAAAVARPKSTVAHHVKVLVDAGLVRVVRTRRVRAIDERFYVPVEQGADSEALPLDVNDFQVAAHESAAAFQDRRLWGFLRHARLSEDQAGEFWERLASLVREFDELPRSGDTVYGFAAGIYPTGHPRLPDAAP